MNCFIIPISMHHLGQKKKKKSCGNAEDISLLTGRKVLRSP